MAIGGSKVMISGGNLLSQRCSNGRLIPKRGQVKLAIAVGMAHSLASLFSVHWHNRKAAHFS